MFARFFLQPSLAMFLLQWCIALPSSWTHATSPIEMPSLHLHLSTSNSVLTAFRNCARSSLQPMFRQQPHCHVNMHLIISTMQCSSLACPMVFAPLSQNRSTLRPSKSHGVDPVNLRHSSRCFRQLCIWTRWLLYTRFFQNKG